MQQFWWFNTAGINGSRISHPPAQSEQGYAKHPHPEAIHAGGTASAMAALTARTKGNSCTTPALPGWAGIVCITMHV